MADYTVKFLRGFATDLPAAEARDPSAFYWTTDEKVLYLGADPVGGTTKDVTAQLLQLKTAVGNTSDLTTAEKTDIVKAINELVTSVKNASENSKLSIEAEDLENDPDYIKRYIVKQGEEQVGIINIPRDLVVQSGSVLDNRYGEHEDLPHDRLIVLTLNSPGQEKIYIPVSEIMVVYKVEVGAPQVQLSIDDSTNTISARIKENSITALELGIDSVLTVNIHDKNVTVGKLADDVFDTFEGKGAAEIALGDAKEYAEALMSWEPF